jgi:divalent metal cation (Fe/Co/Zn/Cd) transporter
LKDNLAGAIRNELPRAEVSVTTAPRALDSETVQERIMVTARNLAVAVHHVIVHAIGDRLAVSLDLEVNRNLSLNAAHEIASRLEAALLDELGPDVEIETHIEPLEADDLPGHDAAPERVEAMRQALAGIAATVEFVRNIHDVRVRETKEGEIVNFHCNVDPTLSVHTVHERVDDVERGLRQRFPSIRRVVGHAEPHP